MLEITRFYVFVSEMGVCGSESGYSVLETNHVLGMSCVPQTNEALLTARCSKAGAQRFRWWLT